MRVIAGSLKGRRLKAPSWEGLRPTSDKLRETLFNVLAPRLAGARVLDVYAGTGAVGIEALSRGASAVTFIELDRRAQALIEENLEHCGITTGYTMIRSDALRALISLRGRVGDAGEPGDDARFDLVLLDPPYNGSTEQALTVAGELLAPDGLLVHEHARRSAMPDAVGPLARIRQLVSGDSALTFYARRL
jgi:16S rRNA (guanine966-N2)-methyltransferase